MGWSLGSLLAQSIPWFRVLPRVTSCNPLLSHRESLQLFPARIGIFPVSSLILCSEKEFFPVEEPFLWSRGDSLQEKSILLTDGSHRIQMQSSVHVFYGKTHPVKVKEAREWWCCSTWNISPPQGLDCSAHSEQFFRRGHWTWEIWEPNLCLSWPRQRICSQAVKTWMEKAGNISRTHVQGLFLRKIHCLDKSQLEKNSGSLEGETTDYKLIPNQEIPAVV